jgi:nitrite reductase/ring-hydroxylating ferredoxin subunit
LTSCRAQHVSAAPPQLQQPLWSPEPWPSAYGPIERARTLPASWYTDPNVARLEATRVFGASWQCVGHLNELSQPGDYITGDVPPYRYLVTRGDDGRLRAFHNVCRHHAAAVACGRGNAAASSGGVFTCPYHGWEYDIRGRLRKAPRIGGIKDFRAAEWGLRAAHVDAFGPLVFVWLGDVCGSGGGSGGGVDACSGSDASGSDASGSGSRSGAPMAAPPPLKEWLGARLGGGQDAFLNL